MSKPSHGHNGAPVYECRNDLPEKTPPLEWFKCNPKDVLDDLLRLPLDERGFYATAWLAMYSEMEMLPADDRMAAHRLGMDVRSYRPYLAKLLERRSATSNVPLLYRRPSGRISNHRYEEEITAYVDVVKKRKEAASDREAKRKIRVASSPQSADACHPDVGGMSDGSGDIPQTLSGHTGPIVGPIVHGSSEKTQQNQIQDRQSSGRALADDCHGSGTDRDREKERKKESSKPADEHSAAREGLAGVNKFVDDAVCNIKEWMNNGDDLSARNWLNSTMHAYGADVFKDAYVKLTADMASGVSIAFPLKTLSNIAARIRDERKAKSKATKGIPAHMQRW